MLRRPTLLHLSPTDIRFDARILRELDALQAISGSDLVAIGMSRDEGTKASRSSTTARIVPLELLGRKLRIPHRFTRHLLDFVELFIRMGWCGFRLQPTVVHCHDTAVLPIGWLLKWLLGCSLIYDAHELESARNGQSRAVSIATTAIEWFCWKKIDLLVSVSPAILDWYRTNRGPKRGVLVMNAPMFDACSRGPAPVEGRRRYFHDRYSIPVDAKIFVYVGILAGGRGIETILDVFAAPLVGSHLVFIGYRDTIGVHEFASRHANIHMHPPVPHDEVVALVGEADVGICLIEDVSLSDRLCLPNKLFEYAFAGIPVLASDLPEIRRVVEQFRLGLCCDRSTASVRAALSTFEKQRMSSPPIESLAELGWQTQAQRLLAAYRELFGILEVGVEGRSQVARQSAGGGFDRRNIEGES